MSKSGFSLALASSVAFQAGSAASPLVSIDDHASIFFNGSVSARYDDNIYLTSNNTESDYVFVISPGLELNIGNHINGNLNIYYREDIYRYSDNSNLDSNQSNVFLEGYLLRPRLSVRASASYEELIQNTIALIRPGAVGVGLVERDLYTASVRGEYEISDLTSVATGANYSQTRFGVLGYANSESIAFPVDFYYSVTPKVDLSVGYRFRNTDTKDVRLPGGVSIPAADYRDHYFNVGVRGEVLPKLKGEGRVGYQDRSFRGVGTGSTGSMSFGADFSYFVTPKITLLTGLVRDFDVGGEGSSVSRTGGKLGARYAFNHLISAYGNINYNERKYRGQNREDDTFDLGLGVVYTPNVHVTLSAGYIFLNNDSNRNELNIDQNVFSISAALRY